LADKLEDRLDSDEKIHFHARHSIVQAIERALVFAIVLFAGLRGVSWLFGGDNSIFGELILNSLLSIGAAIQMRIAAVLVTDRRVLLRMGLWRPKIVEIALIDIAHIFFAPGIFGFGDSVNIRRRSYEKIAILLVPRLEDLCDAILTQKGQAVPLKFNRKVKNALSLMMALTLGFGLLGITAFGFAFIGMIDSADSISGLSAVFIILLVMFLFIPFLLVALILGFIVGGILSLILARFYLSPAEAKELICMDDGSSHGAWMEAVGRWCVRYQERIMSFLYGQKIRCD
jgi:hypothetical protein